MAANWKLLEKETRLITALVMMCQDYVLVDEEFMANTKIKKNIESAEFWIELAKELKGAIANHIDAGTTEGYDDFGSLTVSEKMLMSYVMSPANRFELNDIICESVENWLKHFSGKRR